MDSHQTLRALGIISSLPAWIRSTTDPVPRLLDPIETASWAWAGTG
jgi:hypothetical protein